MNKPKQYQQGWTEFYKLKFFLTSDVLIPRPETELLVDEVLRIQSEKLRVQNEKNNSKLETLNSALTIIDLGTGSGNIAISISKNLPKVKIFATDISEKALKIAEKNAKYHKVDKKIIFLKSDLLSVFCHPDPASAGEGSLTNVSSNKLRDYSVRSAKPRLLVVQNDKKIDILVTNLPYIPANRLPYLDPSVIEFEPEIALNGGSDGFDLYRKLFAQIWEHKFFPKVLLGEIDYTHGDLAVREVQRMFPNAQVEIKTDLAKKQRFLKVLF